MSLASLWKYTNVSKANKILWLSINEWSQEHLLFKTEHLSWQEFDFSDL